MTEQADYKTIIENEKLRLWEEGHSDEQIEQMLEERGNEQGGNDELDVLETQ